MAMFGDISKLNLGAPKFEGTTSSRDPLGLASERSNTEQFKSQLNKKVDARPVDKRTEKKTDKKPLVANQRTVELPVTDQVGKPDKETIDPYNADVPKKFGGPSPIKTNVTEQPDVQTSSQELRLTETTDLEKLPQISEDQKPILQFMIFMKEQYGVEPEELVKALSSLSQDELLATPQESMLSFFKNLGIESDEIEPAKEQYLNLLAQLNKIETRNFQSQPVQPVEIQVLDPQKQRVQDVNKKIDQMNASFFVNPPIKKELAVKSEYGLSDKAPLEVTDTTQKIGTDNFFINSKKPIELKNYSPTQNVIQSENQIQQSSVPQLQPVAMTEFAVAAEAASQMVEPQGLPISESGFEKNNLSNLSEKTNNLEVQFDSVEKSMKSSDNKSENSSHDLMSNQSGGMTFTPDKQVEGSPNSFAAELKGIDRSDKSENPNIQQLVNQANVMIRRGGGEMKMQLNPEGLGNVLLKVKVSDGKVGIQMIADTSDAKRLLEGSINDLKANLSQHKMTVDTFKVDVSDKFNESLNQQSDLNREEARQFLGQFREQNEFRNSLFNDSPGVRAYRQYGGKEPAKQPVESVTTRNDKGRIHLVA